MRTISPAISGQIRVVSTQKNVVSKDQRAALAVVSKKPTAWELDPVCEAFPPYEHDQFQALKASISRNGLQEPIWVWQDRVVDGRHRLKACLELGIEPVVKRLTCDYQQAVSATFAANVNRRQLGTGQLALMAAQLATRKPGQTKAAKHVEAALSQVEAANLFGVSRDAVQKACCLIAQKKNTALLDAVHCGSMTLNEAYVTVNTGKTGLRVKTTEAERKALRVAAAVKERLGKESRTLRLVKQAATSAKNMTLPTGARHSVVLADPPWDYGMPNDRAASRIIPHEQYPTMTIDAICDMGVADIAADDSMLFMWCPASLLPDGLKVVAAWGFEYSSCWIWHKEGQLNCGGGTAAIHHELLLVAKRGVGLTISDKKVRGSSVFGGQVKAHSAKPVVVHERLEALYPNVSRIELFSRAQRTGWTMYGNQAGGVDSERKVA